MALAGTEGWLFLLRWIHFLAGITWIGILYYFNFVQTPFFAETEPPVRSGAIQKLVPRALWWFRWGAMVTFVSGWLYLLHRMGQFGGVREFFATSYGWAIFLGGILGSFMWANVWFVIWPKQKIVIANAIDTAAGRPANPAAAGGGASGGMGCMMAVPRFGLYPGGYAPRSPRASSSSRDEPLIAGPSGPFFDGALLWQGGGGGGGGGAGGAGGR